jgi:hypothetical protein
MKSEPNPKSAATHPVLDYACENVFRKESNVWARVFEY